MSGVQTSIATHLSVAGRGAHTETMSPSDGKDEVRSVQRICRLAAAAVVAMRNCAESAELGADNSNAAAALRDRLLELCWAFYAAEEDYALHVCFEANGRANAQDGCLPAGAERAVYECVARFIASLGSGGGPAGTHAPIGATKVPMLQLDYDALACALGEAGYL